MKRLTRHQAALLPAAVFLPLLLLLLLLHRVELPQQLFGLSSQFWIGFVSVLLVAAMGACLGLAITPTRDGDS